jgi:isocitrate lyase
MAGSLIGDDHKEYFSGEAALKASGSNNTMNQFENVGALSPKKNPEGRTNA